MNPTTQFERDLEQWLRTEAPASAPAGFHASVMDRARTLPQRPGWATSLPGRRFGRSVTGRPWRLLAVAAVLLGSIGTALYVGGSRQSAVTPTPGPSLRAVAVIPTEPPPAPPTGLVAYPVVDCTPSSGLMRCVTTLWLARADGRDAYVVQGTSVIGWSADGSKLVLENVNEPGGAVSLLLANPTGAVGATIKVPCTSPTIDPKYGGHLCPDEGEYALSPDGTRVAFTRTDPNVDNSSVLSVLDLATGQSTVLTATRTTNPPTANVCNASNKTRTCQGFDGSPRWSPDGRSIAFERQGMAPEPGSGWDSAALFVVDADGSDFRRLTPSRLNAIGPAWSPDGTRLTFEVSDAVVNAAGTSVIDFKYDVYTIGVDGNGLARLTHDGISSLPDWTSEGRLAFVRHASPTQSEHWIMDADGGNQSRLGDSLADLRTAGCTTCVYVAKEPVNGQLPRAFWQPVR